MIVTALAKDHLKRHNIIIEEQGVARCLLGKQRKSMGYEKMKNLMD